MRTTAARLLIVGILAFAPSLGAQSSIETSPALVPGDTLRVWASTPKLDGVIATLGRLSVAEIVLQGQATSPDVPPRELGVQLQSLTRLDVLRGTKRSAGRIVAGVLLGAAAGALVGAPLAQLIECGGACDTEGSLQPKVGPALGAAIGAPIGAIIGGVIAGSRRAKWHTVTITVR